MQLDRVCAQTQLAEVAPVDLPGRLFVDLDAAVATSAPSSRQNAARTGPRRWPGADSVVLDHRERSARRPRPPGADIASSCRRARLRRSSDRRPQHRVLGPAPVVRAASGVREDRPALRAGGARGHHEAAVRAVDRGDRPYGRQLGRRRGHRVRRRAPRTARARDRLRAGLPVRQAKEQSTRFVERERFTQSSVRQFGVSDIVGSITRQSPALAATVPVEEVAERFHDNGSLRTAVVPEHGRPMGIVTRTAIMSLYASRYGRNLYGRTR